MIDRMRILLLEANRYYSLLHERTLAEHFTSAVVARFSSGPAALEELQGAVYDVAVLACDAGTDFDLELFWQARESNSNIVLVAIGSADTPPAMVAAAREWSDEYLVRSDDTPDRLPGIISQYSDRWLKSARHPGSEGLLDARTRSSVIRLTVSTLAHEINNPLMTILGTSELLLDRSETLGEDIGDKIRMIQESARRIESTLSDLAETGTPRFRETAVGFMIATKGSIS